MPPALIETRESVRAKFDALWGQVVAEFEAKRGKMDRLTWRRLRTLEARVRFHDVIESPALSRALINDLSSWAISCGRDAFPYLYRLELPPHDMRVREVAKAARLELRAVFDEIEPETAWTDALSQEQDDLIMKRLEQGLNDDETVRLEELKALHEAHLAPLDRQFVDANKKHIQRIEDLIAEITAECATSTQP
ncbi:MAG: hypothetical protein ACKVY0_26305 [Prosthecobacter sp.]|uniref:hypothetical protein n=1 Tax=Prosthecobacter sp. TaxID=1965333 RepID=UPI0038FFFB12